MLKIFFKKVRATWVSLHHGGGVGMGYSQHSGMVICCDGTEKASQRIKGYSEYYGMILRHFFGVMRHADAGFIVYEMAIESAKINNLNYKSYRV